VPVRWYASFARLVGYTKIIWIAMLPLTLEPASHINIQSFQKSGRPVQNVQGSIHDLARALHGFRTLNWNYGLRYAISDVSLLQTYEHHTCSVLVMYTQDHIPSSLSLDWFRAGLWESYQR
jgi:hypothetical protein